MFLHGIKLHDKGIGESTNQRINESTNQRINESANQRISESKLVVILGGGAGFVYSSIRLFALCSVVELLHLFFLVHFAMPYFLGSGFCRWDSSITAICVRTCAGVMRSSPLFLSAS